MIVKMVKYLGSDNKDPEGGYGLIKRKDGEIRQGWQKELEKEDPLFFIDRMFIYTNGVEQEVKAINHYTCNFLDENGNCMVYDLRPQMCRRYPEYDTNAKCHYTGCTYQAEPIQITLPENK